MYAAFAEAGGTLDQTGVFLLDEFVLPPDDPGRCEAMLRRTFLGRLATPPAALHLIDTDAVDLDDEAARYGNLVAAAGIDLCLLGLGANGHIGMNEPGTESDSPTRVVSLHETTTTNAARYGPETLPERGVTLGMATVLAASEIWLLVIGHHKAAILYETLAGPVTPKVPASYLQDHPNTIVFADELAAQLLTQT